MGTLPGRHGPICVQTSQLAASRRKLISSRIWLLGQIVTKLLQNVASALTGMNLEKRMQIGDWVVKPLGLSLHGLLDLQFLDGVRYCTRSVFWDPCAVLFSASFRLGDFGVDKNSLRCVCTVLEGSCDSSHLHPERQTMRDLRRPLSVLHP